MTDYELPGDNSGLAYITSEVANGQVHVQLGRGFRTLTAEQAAEFGRALVAQADACLDAR